MTFEQLQNLTLRNPRIKALASRKSWVVVRNGQLCKVNNIKAAADQKDSTSWGTYEQAKSAAKTVTEHLDAIACILDDGNIEVFDGSTPGYSAKPSTTAADLAVQLNAERQGNEYITFCPVHEAVGDHTPSLSFRDGTTQIVFWCRSRNCDTKEISRLLLSGKGRKLSDDDRTLIDVSKIRFNQVLARDPDAVHKYTSVGGEVVAYKGKWIDSGTGEKHFFWWHFVEGKKTYGKPRDMLPFYNLHNAIRAEEVWVVEGEKDVETLATLGRVATTASDGAGSWNKASADSLLRDKSVVVCPDNDEAGRQYLANVLDSLERKNTRVVRVPAPHKDITDFVDAGGTIGSLISQDGQPSQSNSRQPAAMPRSAANKQAQIPETGKEQSNEDAVQTGKSNVPRKGKFIFTPEEVATMDMKPREYIVEGLLPKVGTSLIAATPKTGKGTLTRQLCVSVANGEPFLGRETLKGRTLFCSRQEMLSDIVEKLKQANSGEMPNVLISPVDLPLPGDAEAKIRAVLQEATECGEPVSLVVLDMLSSFFKMKDGHYDEAFAALEPLQELAVEFNTHICVVHHGNKATTPANLSLNSVMGSAAISGSVDTILGMCADPETDRRCIASWQRTGTPISKHWLDWNENTLRVSLGKAYGHVDDPLQKRRETSERVTEFVKDNPGCSFNKIHGAVGGRYGEIQKIVEELTTEGKHIREQERKGKGGGKAYFPANPLHDLLEQTSSHLPV